MLPPANRAATVGLREVTLPERRKLPWHPLLRVPMRGPVYAVLLSERLYLFLTHYHADAGKLLGCSGDRRCRWCAEGWTPRLYGYAAAQEYRSHKPVLLAIPESALTETETPELLHKGLRGRSVKLSRSLEKRNGPVIARLMEPHAPDFDLLRAWDVPEDIARRFGLALAMTCHAANGE